MTLPLPDDATRLPGEKLEGRPPGPGAVLDTSKLPTTPVDEAAEDSEWIEDDLGTASAAQRKEAAQGGPREPRNWTEVTFGIHCQRLEWIHMAMIDWCRNQGIDPNPTEVRVLAAWVLSIAEGTVHY